MAFSYVSPRISPSTRRTCRARSMGSSMILGTASYENVQRCCLPVAKHCPDKSAQEAAGHNSQIGRLCTLPCLFAMSGAHIKLLLPTAVSGAALQHSTAAGQAAGQVCVKKCSPAERWACPALVLLDAASHGLAHCERADLARGAPDEFLVGYSLRALLRHLCRRCLANNGTPCGRSTMPLLAPKVKRYLQEECHREVLNMLMWQAPVPQHSPHASLGRLLGQQRGLAVPCGWAQQTPCRCGSVPGDTAPGPAWRSLSVAVEK